LTPHLRLNSREESLAVVTALESLSAMLYQKISAEGFQEDYSKAALIFL
jgi:hypothetical protein